MSHPPRPTRTDHQPTGSALPQTQPTQPTRRRTTGYHVPDRAPPHLTLRRPYGARHDEGGTTTRDSHPARLRPTRRPPCRHPSTR